MKKRALCMILALLTVFSLCFTAYAAEPETVEPRYNSTSTVTAKLWFSGSNAMCKLQVIAHQGDASIRAVVRLKDSNGTNVRTWVLSGTGLLNWQDSCAVSRGTYTMTISVTVDHPDMGTDYISDSVTGTY